MTLEIPSRRVTQWLGVTVAALVVAQVTVQALRFLTGNDRLFGLVYMFSLGAETNFPTFYATFSLLFTAVLLAWVASASPGGDPGSGKGYWVGLAVVFAFLSTDEMIGFHERLIGPVRSLLGASNLFFYAWVIPYGVAVLVFAGAYARFLMRLPRRTALLFVLAGALFVTGAIGLEMVGGWYSEEHGNANPVYVTIQTIEELLEMVGVLIFITAILEYADQSFGGLKMRVSSAASEAG